MDIVVKITGKQWDDLDNNREPIQIQGDAEVEGIKQIEGTDLAITIIPPQRSIWCEDPGDR